jgi:hypothetical protein
MSVYMEIKVKYEPNYHKQMCETEIKSLIFILISF